nr:probable protein phosphatase 2C 49 [Ipomoea batatas]
MIVKRGSTADMVAEAEILCQQSVSVQYLCVSKPVENDVELFDVKPEAVSTPPIEVESVAIEISRSESAVSCSTSIQTTLIDSSRNTNFLPSIRSGSYTDIGARRSNEDEHIRIDDLSAHLGPLYRWPLPCSFYAVFDGHGGSAASAYVKDNALRFFFEDAALPQASVVDKAFLEELGRSHHRAFLLADQALADDCSVDASCGTTAITALILGKYLVIANAGDCRAVLCRKGNAVQISHDHRPSCQFERKRVEALGGLIEYGYLNGEISVTRALGDWSMKLPYGSASSPLSAEPEIHQVALTEDDEFLIIGCDGVWDVMSNQDAVSIVRQELRMHNDPQECAKELVNQALLREKNDNLTAIVICFTAPPVPSRRPKLRCLTLSEEARNRLRSFVQGN